MNQQEEKRKVLWNLLGDLPERSRSISAKTLSTEERQGYVIETLELDLNGIEPVPAYFVRPIHLEGPVPAILYNHAHGGEYHIGKEEFIAGRGALQSPAYAEEFARRGWVGLCIDHWAFGKRHGRSESSVFKQMLWNGQVLWGMMVYDSVRALDYLLSRPEVDARRVATVGMSMGSTMAWWLAALDERVKVCADICCLTDYETLIEEDGLDRHGVYYYVPGLLKHFSAAQINELIVPRPHLGVAGTLDGLTPVKGLDKIDAHLKDAYAKAGAPHAWKLLRYECDHTEIPEMRQEVLKWLESWLYWCA